MVAILGSFWASAAHLLGDLAKLIFLSSLVCHSNYSQVKNPLV
jgi:hypothetical protein